MHTSPTGGSTESDDPEKPADRTRTGHPQHQFRIVLETTSWRRCSSAKRLSRNHPPNRVGAAMSNRLRLRASLSEPALGGCENIQSGPRWWSLRREIKERGGGDAVASLTTSDAEIAAQPPPARRVTGGAPPSASPPLLSDVPASPASRRLASDGAAPVTRATLDFFTASEVAKARSAVAHRRTPFARALGVLRRTSPLRGFADSECEEFSSGAGV